MNDKSDLDMQTFQIYQEEDSVEVEKSEPATKPKKKFGFNFKKDNKEASYSESSEDSEYSKKDIIKGVAIGLVVLIVLIVVDQLKLI